MPAPTLGTPTGYRLDNSFPTLITFTSDTSIALYEKEVTPVGYTAGGGIDTTTGRNYQAGVRTKGPKALIEMTNVALTVAYDPSQLTRIMALLRKNQGINLFYPNGTYESFWGFVDSFVPNRHSNTTEDQPTAEMVIVVTNEDTTVTGATPTIATITAGSFTTATTTT